MATRFLVKHYPRYFCEVFLVLNRLWTKKKTQLHHTMGLVGISWRYRRRLNFPGRRNSASRPSSDLNYAGLQLMTYPENFWTSPQVTIKLVSFWNKSLSLSAHPVGSVSFWKSLIHRDADEQLSQMHKAVYGHTYVNGCTRVVPKVMVFISQYNNDWTIYNLYGNAEDGLKFPINIQKCCGMDLENSEGCISSEFHLGKWMPSPHFPAWEEGMTIL